MKSIFFLALRMPGCQLLLPGATRAEPVNAFPSQI